MTASGEAPFHLLPKRPAASLRPQPQRHGESVFVAPLLVAWAFGPPTESSVGKTTGTYWFEHEDGDAYEVYDWKQTARAWPEGSDLPAGFWGSEGGTFQVRGPEAHFGAFTDWLLQRLTASLAARIASCSEPARRASLLRLWPPCAPARTPEWVGLANGTADTLLALAAAARADGAVERELQALYPALSLLDELRGWADVETACRDSLRAVRWAERRQALATARPWRALFLPDRRWSPLQTAAWLDEHRPWIRRVG